MERNALGQFVKTHGQTKSPTYRSWETMKARCTLKNNPFYEKYHSRGITVCEEWVNSFEKFLEDMGERPSKEHTLDRVDNLQGYRKDNCRWATKKEQAFNRSSTILIEWNGVTMSLKQVVLKLGLTLSAVSHRLNDLGWSMEKALTTPVRKRRKKETH